MRPKASGESWLTAAVPIENLHCSCKLTRVRPRCRGEYGPTTVARRETCFNHTQDTEECNWAGPSWPYETSRVLTGLSNFLTEYPGTQSAAAGMDAAHYTRLLRTYAFSMTHGNATNGSLPVKHPCAVLFSF